MTARKKLDPYNHEELYMKWKKEGMKINGLNKLNEKILVEYLNDMELGKNVAVGTKKGSRGYARLRNQKSKLFAIFKLIQDNMGMSIQNLNEDQIIEFFSKMRSGEYKSLRTGKPYTAVGNYVKAFKSFWHWYIRSSKKKGKEIIDITVDLDSSVDKPKFNYFTIEQVRRMCNNSKFDYKIMMMFLFDTGIRAPTELMNVRVSDLKWDNEEKIYTLNIREETSKTFGRRIKLLLCSDILKEYIEDNKLKEKDYLFTKKPQIVNEYISNLGLRLFKIGKPVYRDRNGRKVVKWISEGLTMYDFRHSSACYWLPRYKTESAMKYRFGWKKSDMIHYYTEFLGMKDTIREEDLYIDISKTELEKQITKEKKERLLLQEQFKQQQDDTKRQMAELVAQITELRNVKNELYNRKSI